MGSTNGKPNEQKAKEPKAKQAKEEPLSPLTIILAGLGLAGCVLLCVKPSEQEQDQLNHEQQTNKQ